MITTTLAMMPERFEGLTKFYNDSKIKVLKRDEEFVTFEITISDPFDILEIFSSGVRHGIYMNMPLEAK
jgi:hypothetical protein